MTQDQNVARLQTWDLDAFGDLYEAYFSKIYAFLFYKTFDQESAEDLTAETFLKAFKNRASFRGSTGAEFSSWLYRIAYNTQIDSFRVHKQTDELDESSEEIGYAPDIAWDIDARTKTEEVLRFLDTLGKEQKDIVVMRLWDDLSYEEISEITGKRPETCRKVFSRALAQIQTNIAYVFALYLFQYYFHN